jgi:hypothetical protein
MIAGLVVLQLSSAREIRSAPCRVEVNCTLPCVPHFNRCPICVCDGPTCQNVSCYPGYVCELQVVECLTTPCYLQPTCVAEQQTTVAPCPEVKCELPCVPHRVDGCPRCACDGPTCEDHFCYPDYVCELKEVVCVTTPCYHQPTCVAEQQTTAEPCPEVECEPPCVPDTGDDGCPTCACDGPTCEDHFCYPGYVCELKQVFCITTPCYLQPTCVAEQQTTAKAKPCRVYRCRPDCKPGKGPDGCPICDCPPRCEPRCATDYECKLVPMDCFDVTCPPPQPRCVPKEYH